MSTNQLAQAVAASLPNVEEVALFVGVKIAGKWQHFRIAGQGGSFGLGQVEPAANPPPRERKLAAVATPQPSSADHGPLGNYVLDFGKFAGSRLGDIDIYELADYVNKLRDMEAEKGEPLKGRAKKGAEAIDAWLRSRSFERKKPGPRPR